MGAGAQDGGGHGGILHVLIRHCELPVIARGKAPKQSLLGQGVVGKCPKVSEYLQPPAPPLSIWPVSVNGYWLI